MTDAPPPPPGPNVTPPPAVLVPPPGGSNTMATLALVFGLLSFVCLGPIGGIVAVIFGILGLSKAKELGGTGRGLSIAGIVLAIVNFVVSVVAVIIIVVLIGVASETANTIIANFGEPAPPSSYELEMRTCAVDSFGDVDFSGTITNLTETSKNFLISTEIVDSFGTTLDTFPTPVTEIPPGGKRTWSAITFTDPVGDVMCRVTGVDNLFN